jgi:protein TonB
VDPVYPQSGQEGVALLRIRIQADGRPGDIAVARSTGYPVLGEAAVSAVRNWRFVPAKDRAAVKRWPALPPCRDCFACITAKRNANGGNGRKID